VEEAVELVVRHCLAGHETTRKIRFRLQVCLSEALSNAILRGNRENRTSGWTSGPSSSPT
jgi:anti-sigma regulatory factor (Ser/Thr protein kinase)